MRLEFRNRRPRVSTIEPPNQAPPLRAIDNYGRMLTTIAGGEFTPASKEIATERALTFAKAIMRAPLKEREQVFDALDALKDREVRTGRVTNIPAITEELLEQAKNLV
jgi:hypothetical protein